MAPLLAAPSRKRNPARSPGGLALFVFSAAALALYIFRGVGLKAKDYGQVPPQLVEEQFSRSARNLWGESDPHQESVPQDFASQQRVRQESESSERRALNEGEDSAEDLRGVTVPGERAPGDVSPDRDDLKGTGRRPPAAADLGAVSVTSAFEKVEVLTKNLTSATGGANGSGGAEDVGSVQRSR